VIWRVADAGSIVAAAAETSALKNQSRLPDGGRREKSGMRNHAAFRMAFFLFL